ncbi:MAG TPA: efflux RND transporter periplasmic adaptor subunit [Anaeromyxobacteraceae bacterium]|nr:efflux RND transporter periplasmic adaptor subunit [Anaeromyxobacteraceae bacterium]
MRPASLVAALAVALALTACRGGQQAARPRPPPAVTVASVEVRDVPVEIRAPVDLRPLQQADVGSKILGYVDAVLVDRGDVVRRGQLLALVRPSDLPDQLEAARSSYELAKANKERAEKLAPTGVVSQQELQAATAAFASASAQLGAMGTRLGETRIASPLDGVVAARRLDPGALVGPTAGTGSLLTVERIDVLRVFIPVNERDVAGLKVGQEAHVELDALPGKSYGGRVVRISPAFDPVTRTLDAEVHLKNPGELRSGMYGRGAIVTEVHKDAVVAPVAAVQITNDRTYAFLVNGEAVKRVEVTCGVDGGNWMEIVGGLKRGDEIVTAGTDVLSDGSAIRPVRNVNPYTGVAGAMAAEAPAPAGPPPAQTAAPPAKQAN